MDTFALTRTPLRRDAVDIWKSAVTAVRPDDLVHAALTDRALPMYDALRMGGRILIVGAGKAGAAMSRGAEAALTDCLDRVEGVVNVPGLVAASEVALPGPFHDLHRPLPAPARIRLHPARPPGSNQPTAEGVAGSLAILESVRQAVSDDVCLCLLSGGGSALLPAPVDGITLADKQAVTRLLHACGATINEMNTVRKHLSRIKGGRLAEAFAGRALFSLIISDVIGDPLEVIASGPTAPDATTFAEAQAVLEKYHLYPRVPESVRHQLELGRRGSTPETPKVLPPWIHNFVIGNNARALVAAEERARQLGYPVVNLGSFIQGETRQVAAAFAGVVRSIRHDGCPASPPVCLLSGGETTVTLAPDHGQGGRNQEFVLAMIEQLGQEGMKGISILSGGTDGEDGPTDAAGALADEDTLTRAAQLGLCVETHLRRNDAYHFFDATGDLLRTGLTHTNVMDVRVVLVSAAGRVV